MKRIETVLAFMLVSFIMNGQTTLDSSKYFIKIDNQKLNLRFEQCVEKIQKWNKENGIEKGIITVNVSTYFDKTTYTVSEITPDETVKTEMPDYLSYFGKQLTFWYVGKNALNTITDRKFEQLVLNSVSNWFSKADSYGIILGIVAKNANRSSEVNIPDSLKPIPKVPLPNTYSILTKYPPEFLIKVDFKKITVNELIQLD